MGGGYKYSTLGTFAVTAGVVAQRRFVEECNSYEVMCTTSIYFYSTLSLSKEIKEAEVRLDVLIFFIIAFLL